MILKYNISGMTCNGCRNNVEQKLRNHQKILNLSVDLEKSEAIIETDSYIELNQLRLLLPEKYTITEKKDHGENLDILKDNPNSVSVSSKAKQLRPLFIIFGYIAIASVLLNYEDWNIQNMMLDFMGLFYVVFSFFKLLDLSGFPESFRMYDPLAKLVPFYGWIYPFIELSLAILFLMRLYIPLALVATLLILGITTFGVTKVLFDKKSIQCACLGTTMNLPMTEATFIENIIMILMSIFMLIQMA
ncbi:heavy-metal-associated domain-containing protein [Aquimarina sp. D1M17]|uniref:heavy-metal-associated domain-containing protein n=1 Tax=Aquimarina acroporae TaxID=2937283 RepID=UPI0020BDF6B2|nr:heavy metal-associated domain-containing protein [Aquimarina acroporae]MCK8523471.1 heavy-metal-associated domain-containing protein [Aquimarina acroporae]